MNFNSKTKEHVELEDIQREKVTVAKMGLTGGKMTGIRLRNNRGWGIRSSEGVGGLSPGEGEHAGRRAGWKEHQMAPRL